MNHDFICVGCGRPSTNGGSVNKSGDPLCRECARRLGPAKNDLHPFGGPADKAKILTATETITAQRYLRELEDRQFEALRLYEELPHVKPFHQSKAAEILLFGSNQSGKTTAGLVELVRAALNADPYKKYPERGGRIFLVGRDETHIGQTLYPKLFQATSEGMKMLLDPKTGRWRAVRPWQKWDQLNKHLWKLAPPLIPERYIKEKSFTNKKQREIKVVRITPTDWEIVFFTAQGLPSQGSAIDIGAFDEEGPGDYWYSEVAARLLARNGRFFWFATPQGATDTLLRLYMRAEDQKHLGTRAAVQSFFMHLDSNPYIPEANKDALKEKYRSSPRDWETRIEGKFAILSELVYASVCDLKGVHGVDPFPIPHDWTRYMVLDPGRQVCAALFAAVPPPTHEFKDQVFLYDELYIKNGDASDFAYEAEMKTKDQFFEDFLIDTAYGRQASVQTGMTNERWYAESLRERGVACNRHGSGFHWATNDTKGAKQANIQSVLAAMRIRKDGKPRVRIFRNLRNLDWEMRKYRYQKTANGYLLDTPVDRDDHLMDCLGLLFNYDPQYVEPRLKSSHHGGLRRAMRLKARLYDLQDHATQEYVNVGLPA